MHHTSGDDLMGARPEREGMDAYVWLTHFAVQ